MNAFIRFVEEVCGGLSSEQRKFLKDHTTSHLFKRKEIVLDEQTRDNRLYFIAAGLVKKCYNIKKREYIIDFHDENSLIINYQLDLAESVSSYRIVSIEDSLVVCLDYDKLEEFTRKNHLFERYLRHYHEHSIMKTMSWNRKVLACSAEELYLEFLSDERAISQRISLGELSSYLGIAQVSLSRIRSRLLKEKNSEL